MKPYGIPAFALGKYPDLYTIHRYGLKASKGKIPDRNGIRRSNQRTIRKEKSRRIWKKRYRQILKRELFLQIEE